MTRSGILLLVALCISCGPSGTPDAAVDATLPDAESSIPDAQPDAIGCDPACPFGQECCPNADGQGVCVVLNTDIENCGVCGRTCLDGFGDRCEGGECACGATLLGCGGDIRSLCCPPTSELPTHYCANLEENGDDCGACGSACSATQADRCASGSCVCGESRTGCSGAPTDTCCSGSFSDTACVDLTTDRSHCGACGNSCRATETCRSGTCTVGTSSCTETCPDGHVCCFGECCPRARCDMGLCGGDAGAGS